MLAFALFVFQLVEEAVVAIFWKGIMKSVVGSKARFGGGASIWLKTTGAVVSASIKSSNYRSILQAQYGSDRRTVSEGYPAQNDSNNGNTI